MSKRPFPEGDRIDGSQLEIGRVAASADRLLTARSEHRADTISTADLRDATVQLSDIYSDGVQTDFIAESNDSLCSLQHRVDNSSLEDLIKDFNVPHEPEWLLDKDNDRPSKSHDHQLHGVEKVADSTSTRFLREWFPPPLMEDCPIPRESKESDIQAHSVQWSHETAQVTGDPSSSFVRETLPARVLGNVSDTFARVDEVAGGTSTGFYRESFPPAKDCDAQVHSVQWFHGIEEVAGDASIGLVQDNLPCLLGNVSDQTQTARNAAFALEQCFLPPSLDVDSTPDDPDDFSVDWEASPSQQNEDIMFEDFSTENIETGIPQEHSVSPPPASAFLYDGAPVTIQESLIAVLTFSQTEKLSGVALQGLLTLINLHLPSNNLFSKSVKSFFDSLGSDSNTKLCFYCNSCLRPRESLSDLCDKCINEDRCVEYYVLKPIGPQISNLFDKPGFSDDVLYKSHRQKYNEDNIEDVYDGKCYKALENNSESLKITLTWNTDGVSPYNSSTYSMWPFYFSINELPPLKRFRREHMVLAGLWGSRVKPHPNVFLIHIFNELQALKDSGLRVIIHGSGVNITIEVVCGSCDSPAKATFLNLKHHSGYYSCPRCLIEGERSNRTGEKLVFPWENPLVPRTSENYLTHVEKAVLTKEPCFGVKGPSILYFMANNLFESTSVDIMHCMYLGVTKQMLHLLFDSKFSKYSFSLSNRVKDVNKLLQGITLPHFVERNVIPVDKLAYWKASLLMNFFFHLFLPVLSVVMDIEHFCHLRMLVGGVALLNSESISHADLHHAAILLDKFVMKYQTLYGLRNMTHNLHMVRHLSAAVEENGPLWASSCFGFESLNGSLLSLVHSSTHASLQVAGNLDLLTGLPSRIKDLPDGPAKQLCEKLTQKFRRLRINEKIDSSTLSVGIYSVFPGASLLPENCVLPQTQRIFSFQRILKNGMLFTSNDYRKGTRISCFAQFSSPPYQFYGKILHFLKCSDCLCFYDCKCPGTFFALVHKVDTTYPFVNQNVDVSEYSQVDIPISHLMTYDFSGFELVPIQSLATVCFHFEVRGTNYISVPLNRMELV